MKRQTNWFTVLATSFLLSVSMPLFSQQDGSSLPVNASKKSEVSLEDSVVSNDVKTVITENDLSYFNWSTDSVPHSTSRLKLGVIFSTDPFIGVSSSFDIYRSKTKKETSLSVGVDALLNIVAVAPISDVQESAKQESSLGPDYYTKNLYILEGKLCNPGQLGINISYGSLYAGFGVSYQCVSSYNFSCIQSTYDAQTDNLAIPSTLLFEHEIEGVHSFPLYLRLGAKRERYGRTVDFFFGYATDKFTKSAQQNSTAHQFFVGFQKQL